MAQLHAISSCSSTNLLFHGSKRGIDSAQVFDKFHCTRKTVLQQLLGVKSSDFHGHPVVQNIAKFGITSENHAIQAVMASDKEVTTSCGNDGKFFLKKLNKVVLAYSGGLDTSVIVPWLRENYGCEVVCFTADVGQVCGTKSCSLNLVKDIHGEQH